MKLSVAFVFGVVSQVHHCITLGRLDIAMSRFLRNFAVLEAHFAFATSNQDVSSGFTRNYSRQCTGVKWRDKVFRIILPQVIMLSWMLFTFTWCYLMAQHTGSWWEIAYEQMPVWF